MRPIAVFSGSTFNLVGTTSTIPSTTTLNVVNSPLPVNGTVLTLVKEATAGASIQGQYSAALWNGSSTNVPYSVTYPTSQIQLTFQWTLIPYGAAPGSTSAIVGNYLNSLPSTSPDLGYVLSQLFSLDTTDLTTALNSISGVQTDASGNLTTNSMQAITSCVSGSSFQQTLTSLGATGTGGASFTMRLIDPKRLSAFRTLVTQQTMNAKNTLSLLQGPGIPKRKGVLAHHVGFANSPGEINRHQPQGGGRIEVGKANVWFQPYGQIMSQQGNSTGSPGVRSQLGGFVLEADYEVTKSTLVGVMGGTSTSPYTWGQNLGSGTTNSGYGGLYAGWQDTSGFYLNGQSIFGGSHFKMNRNINFASISRTASSTHSAFQFMGNLELGYLSSIYDWFTCQPFILADYMVMREGSYTETGAQSLNMAVNAKTSQFLQAEAGVRAYTTFALGETLMRPSLELGYVQRRPLGGASSNVSQGLITQPASLVVTGVNKIYNQIAPAVGLSAQFKNGVYLSGNVYGQFGGGLNLGEAMIRLGYEF